MVTQAIHSWNTVLARTAGFLAIAEITNITGPEMSLNTVDVTHLTSPNAFKEFIGGLRDGGELGIEGNFYPGDATGQIGLHADLIAATVQDFRLTFPDGTTWTFKGLVTMFGTGAPLDDKLPFSASIKITALPVLGITATVDITEIIIIEITGPAVVVSVPTPWAPATYEYTYVVLNASTTCNIDVDHNTATLIQVYNSHTSSWTTLQDDIPSGELPIGAPSTITTWTVMVQDAGAVPKYYTLYIVRP